MSYFLTQSSDRRISCLLPTIFQRELEKQQRAEEIKQLNKKADDHYHRTVVRKYGVEPWKKLVGAMGEMMLHAQSFSENRLLGICLREWSRHTKTECELRNELASELNRKILLSRGWQSWRKVYG